MLGSQSLPKPGSPEFTAFFAAAHHRERGSSGGPAASNFSPRVLKPSDGSLSDTCSNYAAPDLQGYYGSPNSPYTTSWMRHSNTYTPSGRSQGMVGPSVTKIRGYDVQRKRSPFGTTSRDWVIFQIIDHRLQAITSLVISALKVFACVIDLFGGGKRVYKQMFEAK